MFLCLNFFLIKQYFYRNPNVLRKLNIKDPNEQPKFQSTNRLSHREADLKLYQKNNEKTPPTNLNDSKKVK